MGFPVQDFSLFEPESDFLFGVFNGITSVADVSSDLDAEVSSDGSGSGFERVGGAKHLASGGNCFLSFPDHADDGAAQHVISQLGEERFLDEVGVVGFEELFAGLLGLHGGQSVSLGFESADNVTDDSALNTIGLDLLKNVQKNERKRH